MTESLVENEAIKNYSPPAITFAIKKFVTEKLGFGKCVHGPKHKEGQTLNIKFMILWSPILLEI